MSDGELVKSEDVGRTSDAAAAADAVRAAQSELEVIFNDDDIAVLNKPSGLRTVPGKAVGPEAETRAHVREQRTPLFLRMRIIDTAALGRNCA